MIVETVEDWNPHPIWCTSKVLPGPNSRHEIQTRPADMNHEKS